LAQAKLVLLVPIGINEEEEHDLLAECHDYLAKPVRRFQLYACLESLVNGSSEAETSTPHQPALIKDSGSPNGYRVLLVEDNPVNLTVSREMLEILGYTVDVAENGLEAVEAFNSRHYDIIAMDCQLPEMDGYEATRTIRDTERTRHPKTLPTPIVALTAHAMQGDRKRCLDAGMNDYLSKPFTLEQLGEILVRWLPKKDVSIDSADGRTIGFLGSEEGTEGSVDKKTLEALRGLPVQDGTDLLTKIIQVYLEDAPRQLDIIRIAVSHGDESGLQNAVHRLRSSSSNLGALKLSDLCKKLETAGIEKPSENSAALLSRIEAEYQSVRTELSAELARNV
jgi:CheY-like chemotaxis protein